MNKTNIIDCFDNEYAFLSNFHPAEIMDIDDGSIKYPSVEHAFQAAKTMDLSERRKIAAADTPGRAKHLGRKVVLREDWEYVKDEFMLRFVFEKFTNDEELMQKLIETGNAKLIEGNTWHDNYWGDCSCEKCKNIKGQNRLGKILMIVRDELVKRSKEPKYSVKEMPYIILNDKTTADRIPVGGDGDWFEEGKCTDCGAEQGEFHYDGCDCERCPVCGLQLLSCDCWIAYTVKPATPPQNPHFVCLDCTIKPESEE